MINTNAFFLDKSTNQSQIIHQCHSYTENSVKDDILGSLPLTLRSKAKIILDHLRKHTRLQWNSRGEIIVDGKLITGSNIIDLIKVQLKDYKSFHPVGEDVFSQLVLKSNVPQFVDTSQT